MSVRAALILLTFAVLGVALSSYVHSRPYMLETPSWTMQVANRRGLNDVVGLSRDGDWLLYCSDKQKGSGWELGASDGSFGLFRCREVWQRHGLWFHYMQKVNE